MYDPKVLAITDEDLLGAVSAGIANVAALSLAANYPTLASIPHSVINGYKNVLSIALATEYSFPRCARAEPIDPAACCVALLFALQSVESITPAVLVQLFSSAEHTHHELYLPCVLVCLGPTRSRRSWPTLVPSPRLPPLPLLALPPPPPPPRRRSRRSPRRTWASPCSTKQLVDKAAIVHASHDYWPRWCPLHSVCARLPMLDERMNTTV